MTVRPAVRPPLLRPRSTTATLPLAFCAALLLALAPLDDRLAGPRTADAAPPKVQAEVECRFVDLPPRIDGRADDEAWQAAEAIDGFHFPWRGAEDRAPAKASRARLVWDREHLYFLAEFDDADLRADVREADGRVWQDDAFQLLLRPAEDKPGCYDLQINAAGALLDMFLPSREADAYDRFRADGKFHLDWQVALQGELNQAGEPDRGWTVEGRLPWRDLLRTGGRPDFDERWKFALVRHDRTGGVEQVERSTTIPRTTLDRPDFHRYEDFGTLKFVRGRPGPGVPPYGVARAAAPAPSKVVGSPDPPLPYKARRLFPKLKLNFPIAVARQPGADRLLVIQQPRSYSATSIHRFPDDPQADSLETLLEADEAAYDLKFHPQFAQNGWLFVGSNGPFSGAGPTKKTRVTRYQMQPTAPYAFDAKSAREIIAWPSDGHNGGALAFGLDGMLYVTSGDGTSDSDTNVTGQGLDHLLAKVLRIDVDRPQGDRPYGVPADNPFVDRPGARPETWAYGLRNPWRMTVDPRTGHLWVGNNGQDLWEQIYFVRKGDNYGWSVMEGGHPFYLNRKPGPDPFVKPAAEHPHSVARSLTGGVVYHGRRFPELQGAYLYGDYSTGKIWALKHDGKQVVWHREIADTTLAITCIALDSHDELLIADHKGGDDGGLYTLDPVPPPSGPSPFPRTLSETGLFTSVPEHRLHPSLIPYSVNSPLWSDGAHKERWIHLPAADSKIEVTASRGWNFPDGTVLVKSFALESRPGDPASRRWIETRLMLRQEGEWVGYSYAWNDEQTDARLVDADGADRSFPQSVAPSPENPAGLAPLPWRFPSRAECMVCHSRAANYVLGLTTLQLNRDHDYGGGVRSNQLRTLEHLGVLKINWAADAPPRWRQSLAAEGLAPAQIDAALAVAPQAPGQRTPVPSSLLSVRPALLDRLADPSDASESLERRVRSYLQSNCAHCHVEAGGGNAQMNLESTVNLDQTKLLDVRPLHHTFDLPDPRLVAPGAPQRSVLLERVRRRGPGQMPPLASQRPDPAAVELIRSWIQSLEPRPAP